MIFLDYGGDGAPDHVGFYYEKDNVQYILHGNWGNKVALSKLDSGTGDGNQTIRDSIMGYGAISEYSNLQD